MRSSWYEATHPVSRRGQGKGSLVSRTRQVELGYIFFPAHAVTKKRKVRMGKDHIPFGPSASVLFILASMRNAFCASARQCRIGPDGCITPASSCVYPMPDLRNCAIVKATKQRKAHTYSLIQRIFRFPSNFVLFPVQFRCPTYRLPKPPAKRGRRPSFSRLRHAPNLLHHPIRRFRAQETKTNSSLQH